MIKGKHEMNAYSEITKLEAIPKISQRLSRPQAGGDWEDFGKDKRPQT
jgi:hypothetical protein